MADRHSLAGELRALGLAQGSALMVHASLRRLGPVAGGADAVLEALMDALGPEGTLMMALGEDDSVPFDALSTPADPENGVLAEVFRRRAGTVVNDHAAARFGAVGPAAAQLLHPVPLHDYYGPGSPLQRFTALGGQVLRLGANTDTVTLTHWAEYLAELPAKRRVRRHYRRADGRAQWIESLDDCDGIAVWRGGDYFAQILVDFIAAGHAVTGPVGRCRAELIEAQRFVPFAVDWMQARLRG
jgi:aminoglycoside N3'-acetyltransferase